MRVGAVSPDAGVIGVVLQFPGVITGVVLHSVDGDTVATGPFSLGCPLTALNKRSARALNPNLVSAPGVVFSFAFSFPESDKTDRPALNSLGVGGIFDRNPARWRVAVTRCDIVRSAV